jgi:uncharacterized repeat protein (TIGR03843 family)
MDDAAVVELLCRGEIEVIGRLVDASNATLLATVTADGISRRCVYKPSAGERPLWDFPSRSLAQREVAAYLLSTACDWPLVPPTVLRQGPLGVGSVQCWVEDAEPGAGVIDVLAADAVPPGWLRVLLADGYDGSPVALAHADDTDLARLAVFDVVANNADRKGGHVLREPDGRLRGVDHGLTFNTEHKLRTVLWGWAGQKLSPAALAVLKALDEQFEDDAEDSLARRLTALLSSAEVARTHQRVRRLLASGRFPRPGGAMPAIPWPPF